jgi:hypothetical protein
VTTRHWFVPSPGYAGAPVELTCGRHNKDGRFIPKNVRLTPGITRLGRAPRRRIPMIGDPSRDAHEIYKMHMREKRKAAAQADALIGRRVTLDPCKCGDRYALIGPGKGPHLGELLCRGCGKHRQWISRESFIAINKFVAEIVNQFSAEPAEIAFRHPFRDGHGIQTQPQPATGRVKFFPRQSKPATKSGDHPGPFDDPVADVLP